QHPDIELEISTGATASACDHRKIDVGIHYVHEAPEGFSALTLFPEVIQLVCSPALLRSEHGLPPLENLVHHTVLHSEYRHGDWAVWLRAAGAETLRPKAELMFKGPGLTYQAAAQGLGVAMAHPVIVMSELLSGRLVMPFPIAGRSSRRLCAVYRQKLQTDYRVQAFSSWLQRSEERRVGQ